MLYFFIAISFVATICLLALDAFREQILNSNYRNQYRKILQTAFVITMLSIVLTSAAGFIYKGNAANANEHLAKKKT